MFQRECEFWKFKKTIRKRVIDKWDEYVDNFEENDEWKKFSRINSSLILLTR